MTGPGGVAQRPGAKPVTRVNRRSVVEQLGRQSDAVAVDGRKQRQRNFSRGDLWFGNFEPATQFQTPIGFRAGKRCCAQHGDGDRACKSGLKNTLAIQRDLSPKQAFSNAKYVSVKMARRSPHAKKTDAFENTYIGRRSDRICRGLHQGRRETRISMLGATKARLNKKSRLYSRLFARPFSAGVNNSLQPGHPS